MIDIPNIYKRLKVTPIELASFCTKYHIVEIWLFGSVLRDDFRADSDVDVLVVFDHSFRVQMSLMNLVEIQYELEQLFGRRVDLIDKESILCSHNWIRRKEILSTAKVIYESRSVLSA